MALITCPDCQASISDAAPACPKCGRPMHAPAAKPPPLPARARPAPKQSIPRLLVLLGLLAVAMAFTIYRVSTVNPPEHRCTLNGLGMGSCTFTNRNVVPSTECGHIELTSHVEDEGTHTSSTFCSGLVWPSSSVSIAFSLHEVRSACATDWRSKKSWSDVCDFAFVAAN